MGRIGGREPASELAERLDGPKHGETATGVFSGKGRPSAGTLAGSGPARAPPGQRPATVPGLRTRPENCRVGRVAGREGRNDRGLAGNIGQKTGPGVLEDVPGVGIVRVGGVEIGRLVRGPVDQCVTRGGGRNRLFTAAARENESRHRRHDDESD